MKKLIFLSALFLFGLFLISSVSAQIVRSPNFVPVPSSFVGSQDAGCGLACMVSMVASLQDERIVEYTKIEGLLKGYEYTQGVYLEEILEGIRRNFPRGTTFPYSDYDLAKATINFLISIL